jgi:hypothetical protein
MAYGRAFILLMMISLFAFGGTLIALVGYQHIEIGGQSLSGFVYRPMETGSVIPAVTQRIQVLPPSPESGNVWRGAPAPPLGGTISVSAYD